MSDPQCAARILVARHGEAEYETDVLADRGGSLTGLGRKQAADLADARTALPQLASNLALTHAQGRPLANCAVVELAVDNDDWPARSWAGEDVPRDRSHM